MTWSHPAPNVGEYPNSLSMSWCNYQYMPRTGTLLMELAETLVSRTRWTNRREIADEMATNRGTLAPWLDYLDFFRAIRGTSEGLEVHLDQLLSTMAAYRTANLRPARPRPIHSDVFRAHDRLVENDLDHVFCMFTAANRWAFFEPTSDVQVYVNRGDMSEATEALSASEPRGRRTGTLQIFLENLDGLSHQRREDLPVTSPLQTVIDLRAHPEGGAHADFLEKNLLPRLREGST